MWLLAGLLCACSSRKAESTTQVLGASPSKNARQATSQAYLKGRIVWESGNRMPSPDAPPAVEKGVARKVALFPALTMEEVDMGESGFIRLKKAQALFTTQSDPQGYFSLEAPAGTYTLLVWEADKQSWYANLWEGNFLNPVELKAGDTTSHRLVISYQAVY